MLEGSDQIDGFIDLFSMYICTKKNRPQSMCWVDRVRKQVTTRWKKFMQKVSEKESTMYLSKKKKEWKDLEITWNE